MRLTLGTVLSVVRYKFKFGRSYSKFLLPSKNQTEFFSGFSFIPGPFLPEEMYSHCSVEYAPGKVLLLDDDKQYFYDVSTGRFTRSPNQRNLRRAAYACGAVGDGGDVLVVGGVDFRFRRTAAVEIYNVATGHWRHGPDFPVEVSHPGSVTLGDGTFVLVGGMSGRTRRTAAGEAVVDFLDTLYEYVHENRTADGKGRWRLRPERLSEPKSDVAVVVVDEDAIC